MKRLYIMVGGPGAGKSTFIRDILHKFKGYTVVVSRDDIRFRMVSPTEDYFSREPEVYKKYVNDIKDALLSSEVENVIADATHLNLGSRTKLLRALGTSLKGVEVNAIVINTSMEVAEARNELRAGTRSYVPVAALRKMHQTLTMPELEEGFDNILILKMKGKER